MDRSFGQLVDFTLVIPVVLPVDLALLSVDLAPLTVLPVDLAPPAVLPVDLAPPAVAPVHPPAVHPACVAPVIPVTVVLHVVSTIPSAAPAHVCQMYPCRVKINSTNPSALQFPANRQDHKGQTTTVSDVLNQKEPI